MVSTRSSFGQNTSEECSQNDDDALMYSQFCYYIQQNEQKRRATMHIPRKAGQQIEVDWTGDPAKIIDPDTGEITEAWIFVGVMTYSQYAFVEAFIFAAYSRRSSFNLVSIPFVKILRLYLGHQTTWYLQE